MTDLRRNLVTEGVGKKSESRIQKSEWEPWPPAGRADGHEVEGKQAGTDYLAEILVGMMVERINAF
jgi:hypothetical protein